MAINPIGNDFHIVFVQVGNTLDSLIKRKVERWTRTVSSSCVSPGLELASKNMVDVLAPENQCSTEKILDANSGHFAAQCGSE